MSNQRIYNWKPGPVDERDIPSTRHLKVEKVALPAEFELDRKIPIYDQLALGSCTSNSGCACYRYEYAQVKNDFDFEPSRLFLYWNTRYLEGTTSEDSGAYIRDVFKALNKWGLAPESDFPYVTSTFSKKPTDIAFQNGLKNLVVKYTAVQQNETIIKQTLLSGAAVSFGFTVYDSFERGNWDSTTGIMPIPKRGEAILGGHACFTKDTKISLLDGREVSFEYLLENYIDKQFYVYSYDLENNKIVPGLAHSPRKTGAQQEILKITLDTGEEIKCTNNHPFLLKSGEYKAAECLEIGQSLMPLYRRYDGRGYEEFLENGKWKLTHRHMVDWTKKDIPQRTTVHHKDFNKLNNSPDNLELMTWEDHTILHTMHGKLLTEYAQSERGRQKSRELMSALWADPIWKENRLKQNSINGTKTCEKLKEEGRCGFQAWDKNEHSRISRENGLKNVHNMHTPEANTKRVETVQERLKNDPEFLVMKQEIGRKNFQTYNEQLKNGEIALTEEQLDIKKKTAIQNLKNATPEKRLLGQRKTTYTRFYKDQYETFEDFVNDRYPENHKVVNIEYCGVEDVYDITVEKYHNFALSSGVFVHNCTAIGFSDSKQAFKIQNSWGEDWGLGGYFWMPYSFLLNPAECDDFWCIDEIRIAGDNPTPSPEPNWEDIARKIFTSASDLYKCNEDTVVRLGLLLNLDVNKKYSFKKNWQTVCAFLDLK